jgi:peptidoglycan/LPS O-acetylase OafA/YrhL
MPPPRSYSGQPVTAEQTTANQIKGYIPTLDGWRAAAILSVIFAHSHLFSLGGFSLRALHKTGSYGVDLFFALSGFLICTRLLREEEAFGAISLRSFYTRRIFRIQPAAIAYLLTIALLGAFGVIAWYGAGIAGALLMIRNIWPPSNVAGYWQTVHFWSLSVEEHFYLLLPGFLVLCRRRRLTILALAVLVLEIWRQFVFRHPPLRSFGFSIFLRTDIVLGGILLGSVFALALRKDGFRSLARRLLPPWVALLYAAFVFTFQPFHTALLDHAPLITVFPVLIIATVLHPDALTAKFLELPPVRFIGRISYSLYLWQQLFFYPFAAPAPGSFLSHPMLCLAATFTCAIASYYLIETPLIRVGHRLARRFDRRPMGRNEPARSYAQGTSLAS